VGTWYTTREDVMSAQDIKSVAYASRDIDRAIESGARSVEGLLHRAHLYPWLGTRSFDYPGSSDSPWWRIWLGQFSLISLASIANSDGTSVPIANTFLQPISGPPYTHVDINRGTSSSFSPGTTTQRSVSLTGLWGYANDEETAGTVVEDLDTTETGVDGSAMPTVGVGSLIRVDSERMLVTDKTWLTSGQTGSLAVQNSAQSLTVANGAAFLAGETLLIDAERVRVVDVAGNVLIVRRAVDGSTLAAHTSATVYALRLLTVQRGAGGTTAATHTNGATVNRWIPPGLAAELNLAYAVDHLLQRQSGYARTTGSGEAERELNGRAIRVIEQRAVSVMGRRARTAAV
jgi:hypothetical protein